MAAQPSPAPGDRFGGKLPSLRTWFGSLTDSKATSEATCLLDRSADFCSCHNACLHLSVSQYHSAIYKNVAHPQRLERRLGIGRGIAHGCGIEDGDVGIGPSAQSAAVAWLAAVLALTGQEAEARDMLERYFLIPGTKTRTIARWRSLAYWHNPAYLAFRERFYDGLRKAGMPET